MHVYVPKTRTLIRVGVSIYVFALCLIASFSIAFHYITDSIVTQQQATARVVNVSGRQRMLSQRIAKLSLERATHTDSDLDAETRGALIGAIDQMEKSANDLKTGSQETGASVMQIPAVAKIYTTAPWKLDQQLSEFFTHARAVANKPLNELSVADRDLIALEAGSRLNLLDALNMVVQGIQDASEASIQHLRRVLATITLVMLTTLLLEALLLYRPLFIKLEKANEELILVGRTDVLTGCLNRGGFADEAALAIQAARANGSLVSVMMIDIDRFKSINDTYGHAAGDKVINEVARMLAQKTRRGNVVCRMGGEEFAIILQGCTMQSAEVAAENLRAVVERSPIDIGLDKKGPPVKVTLSIGVATLRFEDVSLFHTLNRADKALYRAKQDGRNRIERELDEATDVSAVDESTYRSHVRVE